jgi:hypothetical protein
MECFLVILATLLFFAMVVIPELDWECSWCSARNEPGTSHCRNCGARR